MFGDTLAQIERSCASEIVVWGLACLIVGGGLLIVARRGSARSDLIAHFALQTMTWGSAETLLALAWRYGIEVRDLAGASRLDRLLWLGDGLAIGVVAVGLAITVIGARVSGRAPSLLGTGIAITIQGAAVLLVLSRLIGSLATVL